MKREELIDLEVAFTDEWYKEHTGVPTYADAIEWAINNPPKGTSIIKWQTGEPKEKGSHLVTLLNGNVRLTEFFKYQVAGREFWDSVPCKMENITAWCKLSDVEPYK